MYWLGHFLRAFRRRLESHATSAAHACRPSRFSPECAEYCGSSNLQLALTLGQLEFDAAVLSERGGGEA